LAKLIWSNSFTASKRVHFQQKTEFVKKINILFNVQKFYTRK